MELKYYIRELAKYSNDKIKNHWHKLMPDNSILIITVKDWVTTSGSESLRPETMKLKEWEF